ncbi:hypothetical protein C7974DRAFT_156683 [Boeremia exigua]|uniref:uncharacterized protein n=1 Tax=Boeremia exigua TaxID=749465 RepID=UPI001E8ED3C5|nr:uncharacterized protein C7974DRAFT_156683 [Boeremia exigua]KAH6638226.1 hypothetical protein C7974DRAFT_156683 [Boeremia exigua]
MICEFALTTESNTIYIFEEADKLRPGVTSTGIMPVGGFRQAFASHHRYNVELPKPYNQLQYTCKELYREVRGMEFQQNEIQCNGWTFDTFRSQLQTHPNQAAWYANVRLVTLIGNFSIGHHVDETLLHGILKFGETHPKAIIRVCVPNWKFDQHLQGFLTFGYRILEAIRGEAPPSWIKAHKGMKKNWRRGKHVKDLNIANVRFFPSNMWNKKTEPHLIVKMLKKKQACVDNLLHEHGSIQKAVDFIGIWASEGI